MARPSTGAVVIRFPLMRVLAAGGALLLLFALQIASPQARQTRLFTSGTPGELAAARQLGLERVRAVAIRRGVNTNDLAVSRVEVDAQSFAHTRVQQRFR